MEHWGGLVGGALGGKVQWVELSVGRSGGWSIGKVRVRVWWVEHWRGNLVGGVMEKVEKSLE